MNPKRYFKCIDNSGHAKSHLTVGKIYEALQVWMGDHTSEARIRIVPDDDSTRDVYCYMNRFVEVFDYDPQTMTIVATKAESKPEDKSAEMVFFSAVPAGYCPCKILRSECKFHS